jgi:hypothetical protein
MTSIDQHLTKAAQYFDETIAPKILMQADAMITAHGEPTEDEYKSVMTWRECEVQREREDFLTGLRAWLERNGETLQ